MITMTRRRYGGKVLPYDAEVEWLKSDRNCLVDTGIYLFDTGDFELSLRFMPTVFYNYVSLFASSTDTYESWISGARIPSVRINYIQRNFSKISAESLYDLQIIGKNNEKLTYTLNGESKDITRAFKSDVGPLCLFGGYGNIGGVWMFYHLELKKDDAVVRDLIPVRVSQVGYLYDKVSGQLFGNSGTGAFVLGPDVISGGVVTNCKPVICVALTERGAA